MADDIEDLLREVEEKYLPMANLGQNNNLQSKETIVSKQENQEQIVQNNRHGKTTARAHSSDIV